MALDATKNFLIVTVSQGYGSTDTSITLHTGQGALLPTPPFNLIWWNATDYPNPALDPNVEIVRVTAVSVDTITILRAQEGTVASAKNTPGKVYQMINAITSKMITDIDSKKANVAASPKAGHLAGVDALGNVTDSGYIPPSGNIIGDTDTQTLTNKTLIGAKFTTSINAQTGTTYTLVLSDNSNLVTFNNTSAITVTVPANSSVAFPIGTQIDLAQIGTGKVTVAGASGVTINSKAGNKSIAAQWVGVSLFKIDTDTWLLLGDLIT